MEFTGRPNKHLIFYNLSKEHLFKDYRDKYIKIGEANLVGNFPVWSVASGTQNIVLNMKDSYTRNFS